MHRELGQDLRHGPRVGTKAFGHCTRELGQDLRHGPRVGTRPSAMHPRVGTRPSPMRKLSTLACASRLQRILPAARWELRFKASHRANPPCEGRQRHVPLGGRGPLLLVGQTDDGRTASLLAPDS
ncbi:hypothetical protein VNO78_38120 [Psophocarpus tetragonolobus]|uniref:Uncharacterized protein n=1 Tax=Psophocarpus tetragonolobus TaxID=3891 RepID=A0AAN9NAM4_PSOTE